MEQYDDRLLLQKCKINMKRGGKSTVDGGLTKRKNKRLQRHDLRNKLRNRVCGRLDDKAVTRWKSQETKLFEGGFGWYKVMISYGASYERSELLQQLSTRCTPLEFRIYACETVGTAVVFHVDDFKLADRLESLSDQITMPNARKLGIRVFSSIPKVKLTNSLKETLTAVLTKRYDSVQKVMNLDKFHGDSLFADNGQFCALFNQEVYVEVFRLISTKIPDVRTLKMSNNFLNGFCWVEKYLKPMRSLSTIDVSNNRINTFHELYPLKSLPISDIVLTGNSITTRYSDKSDYKSEVRKVLPKLTRLDGVQLVPNMTFGTDNFEELNLPDSKPKFLAAPGAEPTVKQFLEQYFLIYDSDNRQPLLDAYQNDCHFSISISYIDNTPNNQATLRDYHLMNRNLIRYTEPHRRQKTLKHGKLQTVALLNDLPKTKHDLSSFTVDLSLCTPEFLHLTVNGMFQEVDTNFYRYFSKNMIIVPCGNGGVCIVNDMLHITNPPQNLIKNAMKSTEVQNRMVTNNLVAQQTVSSAPVMNTNQEQLMRLQMIQQVAEQTKMNLRWSEMCLNETNWDINKALFAFSESLKKNAIPNEAFLKE